MGVRLPSAYQEVEYLESTRAGQYIDTLESVTNDIVVRAKFRFLTSYWQNYQSAFGAKGTSFDLQRGASSTTAFSVATFGTSVRVNVNYNIYQADTIAERSINSVTINGVTTALSVGQGTPSGTIWLFGKESANKSAIDVAAGTRIYSAEILSGNIVLKHFIPCYRKSDDEAGLYDLVSGTFFTNAGTGEFVVGPDVIDSISPWLVARRRWIMAAASRIIKRIATGVNGVVNFVTKVKKPMKVTCEFSPVQEGTGDPSPDNVRPISGWTGCEITHTGKNLLNVSNRKSNSYIDNNGIERSQSGFFYTLDFTPVIPGETYAISWLKSSGNINLALYYYDVNKNFIGRNTFGAWTANRLYTPDDNTRFIRFQGYNTIGQYQIERGSSFTDYEPYKANVLPITFTDPSTGDPLTVYGGTLTLNEDESVDLVEDWYHFTWDGVTNKATRIYGGSDESQQYVNFYSYISVLEKNIVGTRWVHNTVICDTLSEGSTGNPEAYHGNVAGNYCYIYIRKDVLSEVTVTGVNAYLQEHPVTFSGKALDGYFTPNVYHFDNIGQLQSFLGNNAVWHDMNGQIAVEYYNYQ